MKNPGYIYLIRGIDTPWYKIGKTADPKARIKAFNTQGPFLCEVVRLFKVNDMNYAEAGLHDCFRDKRVQGEWFTLDSDDLDTLLSIRETPDGYTYRTEDE